MGRNPKEFKYHQVSFDEEEEQEALEKELGPSQSRGRCAKILRGCFIISLILATAGAITAAALYKSGIIFSINDHSLAPVAQDNKDSKQPSAGNGNETLIENPSLAATNGTIHAAANQTSSISNDTLVAEPGNGIVKVHPHPPRIVPTNLEESDTHFKNQSSQHAILEQNLLLSQRQSLTNETILAGDTLDKKAPNGTVVEGNNINATDTSGAKVQSDEMILGLFSPKQFFIIGVIVGASLLALLCCICCVCFIIRRRRREKRAHLARLVSDLNSEEKFAIMSPSDDEESNSD